MHLPGERLPPDHVLELKRRLLVEEGKHHPGHAQRQVMEISRVEEGPLPGYALEKKMWIYREVVRPLLGLALLSKEERRLQLGLALLSTEERKHRLEFALLSM